MNILQINSRQRGENAPSTRIAHAVVARLRAEQPRAQAARVSLDDALIGEIQWADVLVLGVPMCNFGVPAQLKNWIDAVVRAGVTFRYTERGPQGLLKGKQAVVAQASGGRHRDSPADTITPHLKTALAFVGIDAVQFVDPEGLAMGLDGEKNGRGGARAQIAQGIVV
ncbi:MAG: NAD(P)H-dependent oxidoreductase [Betaproteobacteria bacterium]|nr:NAD(P)H-dependent oxidoreductase [Betaproteobacteria bacterium]